MQHFIVYLKNYFKALPSGVWPLYIYPLECGSYTETLWSVAAVQKPSGVWQLYRYLLEWGSCTCVHIPGLHNDEQELA